MGEHLYKQLSAAYDLGFEAGTYDVKRHQAGDILVSATATSSLPRTRLAFHDYGQGYADAVGDRWSQDGRHKELTKLQVYADRLLQKNPVSVSKPVLIALGIGGAALVGIVAWRIYSQPTALPASIPAPSPPTPLTPVEPPLPAPQSGMWVPAQTMETGTPYLAVFKIMPGAPKPSPQDLLTLASAGRMGQPTIIYWPNSGIPWPVELASRLRRSIDRRCP